ncbi:hypothetical protein RHMOL_Rhmol01G0084200 [Rhododendron molle]|uniref:Uncharacterized protein n=1 Tax=Rhododendron molle TaxID=49168 RepID=A0ACC0PZV9_RHOML|nr:hypothetical protein RHMOL_Rhmol01G0084200 [Rhododendron molle]
MLMEKGRSECQLKIVRYRFPIPIPHSSSSSSSPSLSLPPPPLSLSNYSSSPFLTTPMVLCYVIAGQVTGEAGDNLGERTNFLRNNVAVLQRPPPSEPLVAATGSTRIARSGELSVPFRRQLLEMFLVDALSPRPRFLVFITKRSDKRNFETA